MSATIALADLLAHRSRDRRGWDARTTAYIGSAWTSRCAAWRAIDATDGRHVAVRVAVAHRTHTGGQWALVAESSRCQCGAITGSACREESPATRVVDHIAPEYRRTLRAPKRLWLCDGCYDALDIDGDAWTSEVAT